MKRRPLELLSPAGSFEALKAAVVNGADAVYLGGGRFNARANAGNFIGDELIRAFDYAHERGVRVYVTLNTLLKEEELDEALEFAAFSYREGADAFIIQDLGLLGYLSDNFPDLPLHASTQMTITNTSSVLALEDLGIERVVLARELSLEEIRKISDACKAELEIFVHGALCVCYSGQCLMSSFIGARSGNRGLCAQPCRLPWSLSHDGNSFGKNSYLISTRDLMAIELLPELKNAGVASLKLEGRMKSPEYVGIVTSIYRKYLDLLDAEGENNYKVSGDDIERLLQAFNRGGFTQNYLNNDRNYTRLVYKKHPKNQGIYIGTVEATKLPYVQIKLDKSLSMGDGIEIMDPEKGPCSMIVTDIMQNGDHSRFAHASAKPWIGDVKTKVSIGSKVYKTLSKPLFEEARNNFERGYARKVPIWMSFFMEAGQGAVLKAWDDAGNKALAQSDDRAQKAINKPLSKERIYNQLNKTGDTPYKLEGLDIKIDGNSVIPISQLNMMRRRVLDEISRLRAKKRISPEVKIQRLIEKDTKKYKIAISAYFYEVPQTFNGMEEIKRIYLPITDRDILESLRNSYKGQLFLRTPTVLRDVDLDNLVEQIGKVSDLIDGLTYGSIGASIAFKEAFAGKELCADYSMNVFNNGAVKLQKDLGASTTVLSPELRLSEVREFSSLGLELEALIYGRVPLMIMEHCPSAAERACSGICSTCKKSRGLLKDRKGEVFPFIRDTVLKRTQIFNSRSLFMDDMNALKDTSLSLLRLCFTHEGQDTRRAVIEHFLNKLNGSNESGDSTIRIIEKIKEAGITKGHWYRGV